MSYMNCNLYHFAGNNPIRYLDSDGRSERDTSNVKLSDHFKSDKYRIKNKIAEFISARKCEAYKIEVNWNDKFTIGPEGAKFGE